MNRKSGTYNVHFIETLTTTQTYKSFIILHVLQVILNMNIISHFIMTIPNG